jgi:hypothetical protein
MTVIAIEPKIDSWLHCQDVTELPRPTETKAYNGWKIGIVVKESKLHKVYIHHPDRGAWIGELTEPVNVPKKSRFDLGIAAIGSFADEPELDPIEQARAEFERLLALPIVDRPKRVEETLLSLIRRDGDTQRRVGMHQETISNYTILVQSGEELPPLKLIQDAQRNLWLYDGFHTFNAVSIAGFAAWKCEIIAGTLEEAQDLALSANATHGLPRSNADKQEAVRWALVQDRHRGKSDEAIAALCRVSPPTVKRMRSHPSVVAVVGVDDGKRFVQRGGQTYEVTIPVQPSLDEVQALYEPWGDIERVWGQIKFWQRGRLIAEFKDLREAADRHPQIAERFAKLVDLPPGNHSCLHCAKREAIGDNEWHCQARNTTHSVEADVAVAENGYCRLFGEMEIPAFAFNAGEYVELEAPAEPAPEQAPEIINPNDYVAPQAKNAQHSSESNEHYTPSEIIEAARSVMGEIDFDPFSSEKANQVVKAEWFLTIEEDAFGALPGSEDLPERVWCNPPGGRFPAGHPMSDRFHQIKATPEKFTEQERSRATLSVQAAAWDLIHQLYLDRVFEQVVFLAFSLELLAKRPEILGYPICITHRESQSEIINGMGRIKFLNEDLEPQSEPTHGSVIVYLPERSATDVTWSNRFMQFFSQFEQFGEVGRLRRV